MAALVLNEPTQSRTMRMYVTAREFVEPLLA